MNSILSTLTQTMTPDLIGKLGKFAGLDTPQTQKGLAVVGPLLLGSLARHSQTTNGMDAIMRMLPQDSAAGALSSLLGSGAARSGASAAALTGMLGPGVSSVGKALSSRLGFDAAPLLTAVAPTVLGVISQTAKTEKLNSMDLAKMLQSQHTSSLAEAKPEVRAVLDEAFSLEDKAEKLAEKFDRQEWRSIQLSPLAVITYVVSASPSGVSGLTKEVATGADALKSITKDALPTSLVDVAFGGADMVALAKESEFDPKAPRSSLLAHVKATASVVKAKSPSDAQSFGAALIALSRKVAEASKEGGFLGVGGIRVSKEEEQAIADITSAVEGRS